MSFTPKVFHTSKGRYYIDRIGQVSRDYDKALEDGNYIGRVTIIDTKYNFYLIGVKIVWQIFDSIDECIEKLSELGY